MVGFFGFEKKKKWFYYLVIHRAKLGITLWNVDDVLKIRQTTSAKLGE